MTQTTPHRRPPHQRLTLAVKTAPFVAWLAVIAFVYVDPPAGSMPRMLANVAIGVAVTATSVPLVVTLLGDRMRTTADAYLIGYAHGQADAAEQTLDSRRVDERPLRLVANDDE